MDNIAFYASLTEAYTRYNSRSNFGRVIIGLNVLPGWLQPQNATVTALASLPEG